MPPTDPRTDQQLVADYRDGDASAFDALYARYRDWVVRLAYRFCGNEPDALDALQETFFYLSRRLPMIELHAAMTSFLYPVVRNSVLAARRKKRVRVVDPESLAGVPAHISPDEGASRQELAVALGALPDAQREVLLMRFVDCMQLDEIAAALGIPVGTVKSRLHNALRTLREDPRATGMFLSQ